MLTAGPSSSSFEALATSHAEVGCSGSGGAVTHADAGQEGGGVTRQDDDTNAPPGRSPTGGPDRRADRRHDGDDVGAVGVQGGGGGVRVRRWRLAGGRGTTTTLTHPRVGLRLGVQTDAQTNDE